MKKITVFFLLVCISFTVMPYISGINAQSYAQTQTETDVYEDLITYDIWKHSNGSWQYTGSPGSDVSFRYTSKIYADPAKKLLEVRVEYFKVPLNHIWYDMSLRDAFISSVKYDSSSVSYNVKGNLNANIKPLDIKQYDWQKESVEGYRYYIPVKITVVYEKNDEDITEQEPEEDPDAGTDIPGEDSGSEEAVNYEAFADLFIPDKAYRGHKVLLQDFSRFTDGTREYSAYQFYKEGLGSNSFRKESGDGELQLFRLPGTSPGYYTDRYGVFSREGEYEVKLTAKINGGYASADTETIQILPVPDVSVQLGGIHKQNRKQVINVAAALDPDVKLKKMWIEICEKDGGSMVHLDYCPGEAGEIANSSLIKTRKIKSEYSDKYFERISMEFLTKNDSEKVMKYTVYAEDVSGKSDTESGYFTVYPDEAPAAALETDRYCIRNKGSSTADIQVKDVSLTYGDEVSREWSIKKDGVWTQNFDYSDNSFGSDKNIIHHKEGVGEAEYRLVIKDVIPEEETLSEYITDADYKSDTAYGMTEVINIAPSVELEARKIPEAEILVITDEENMSEGCRAVEELRIALAEKGIKGKISFQLTEGNLDEIEELKSINRIESPFSYLSQWTSYEDKNFISDSRKVYKMGADFGVYGGGQYNDEPEPGEPYTLSAYDIYSGTLLWEKTFYNSLLEAGTEFSMSQDDSEDYLYINAGSKTLIVDKKEGSFLGTADGPLSGNSFVTEKYIYSFSENGIISVNRTDGKVRIISDIPVKGKAVRLRGKINFAVNIDGAFKRGYFDPENESIEYEDLNISGDAGFEGFDFDVFGNFAAVKYSNGKISSLRVWDENNILIKEISAGSYEDDCIIVRDKDGRFAYAGFIYNKRKTKSDGSKKYYVSVKMNGIYDNRELSGTLSSSSDYRTSPDFIYGYCEEDKVIFVTSSEYWYVFNYGTSAYSERSYCYEFNLTDNSCVQYRGAGSFSGLKGAFAEYGELSDSCLVLQYTEGNPVYDGIKGSTTMFAGCGKNPDYLLSKYYNKFMDYKNNASKAVFIIDGGKLITPEEYKTGTYGLYDKTSSENVTVYAPADENEIKNDIEKFMHMLDSQTEKGETGRRIFKKGERIDFKGIYSDYENDPSKQSFYMYFHYPFNDGANEEVNYITDDSFNIVKTLKADAADKPIERFYKDGMYKIIHWQYDSTGTEKYDKKSNVAEMVFYIEGDASAPEIESIKNVPEPAAEGEELDVAVKVNDSDGDTLKLVTKIYLDGNLLKENITDNIIPDEAGNYSEIIIPVTKKTGSGNYRVICRVSDDVSSSASEHAFTVLSDYEVSGNVRHTPQWDTNRKKYNISLFGNECNYTSDYTAYVIQSSPRKRGINVFWSEEKFILNAAVSGEPEKVIAEIKGCEFQTVLEDSGTEDSEGNRIFEGELWDRGIKGYWGKRPAEISILFTAYYKNGISREFETAVIIDDEDSYWRVHKLY